MLSSDLNVYLSNFIAPFVGNWFMQFFLHQLIYSNNPSVPSALKNVVPLIGPLHISLNARECVLLNFYQVFADLYSFLFGKKAKLAKKPKLWRISLLSEVIYGGWTLICDMVLSVFHKCKDIEFLTLLNPPWQLHSTSFEHLFNCLNVTSMNFSVHTPVLGYVCCIPKTSLQQSITNHAFNIFALTRKYFNYV